MEWTTAQCFESSAEASFQNQNKFFLRLFGKYFHTYWSPNQIRAGKLKIHAHATSQLASYDPTKIEANFERSWFSSKFELKTVVFIFSIFIPKHMVLFFRCKTSLLTTHYSWNCSEIFTHESSWLIFLFYMGSSAIFLQFQKWVFNLQFQTLWYRKHLW